MQVRPLHFGFAAAVVVALSSSAYAERISGTFERMDAESEFYVLVLSDGKSYEVNPKVYGRYKSLLSPLKKGDKVTFDNRGKKVVAVYPQKTGKTTGRTLRLGVFEKYDSAVRVIWLADKTRYTVRAKPPLDRKAQALLLTLVAGNRIRLMIESDRVVDVARRGKRGEEERPEVRKVLEGSRAGDAPVQIRIRNDPRFLTYKLIGKRATEIEVSPQIPNSNPPAYEGKIRIRRGKIDEMVNPQWRPPVNGGGGPGVGKKDSFEEAQAQIGDMIRIGFNRGQLVALTEDTYTWRTWRNGRWEPATKPEPRKSARGVRHENLTSHKTFPLEGGELELTIERSRKSLSGGLKFKVALTHTVKSLILVDVQLRFSLSNNACMEVKQKPDRTETKLVAVPMFANQRQEVVHEIVDESLKDGRVEVVLSLRNQVKITSKQARKHLIAAMVGQGKISTLKGVYQAAAANGGKNMCRFMIARELGLQAQIKSGRSKDPHLKDHELELRKGLNAYGKVAPTLILDQLFGLDRQLKSWGERNGQIVQVPLPAKERAQTYKRKLIALLASLELGIEPTVGGERLFDLYVQRAEDFKEEVVRAYRQRPEDAVASLLHVAVDLKDRERAEKAGILLRELGQPILPALFNELNKKGLNPKPLRDALSKGTSPPKDIVRTAVDELVSREYKQVAQELEALIEEAGAKRASKDYDEALKLVRGVMEREPTHKEAIQLLPDLLIDKARELRSQGQRGRAALALEEALRVLKGPQQSKAKNPLGEMLVEAAKEELESILLKAEPHAAAEGIKPLAQGAILDGDAKADPDWLMVHLEGGKKGYVRKSLVAPMSGAGKWQVNQNETPYATLAEQLKRAEEYSAGVGPAAGQVLGSLSAREGERRYNLNDFENALAYFNTAAELTPDDPRLSLRTTCWVKANTAPLVAIGAVVAFVLGIVVMQAFSRPSKVKFAGEYRHYGAERSRRERDMDVE
jgi:tetratricopeptide (TPR) repeat protein